MRSIVILIPIYWVLTGFTLHAQNYFTVLDFLKWPIDPVAVGRGESGTASATGIQALTFNPAHVNQLQSYEVFYNRRALGESLTDDLGYFVAGVAYRFKEKHILTIYWRRFGYGELAKTDPHGFVSETYNPYDMALGLVYGRGFGEDFTGGITLQFLRSTLSGTAENSWAFDLGINRVNLFPSLTFIPSGELNSEFIKRIQKSGCFQGLNIGAALLNAGPHIAYLDESQADPIPQRLRVGIAYQAISSEIFGIEALFDFEKELVHWNEDERKADPFYKAWITGWQGKTFKEAIYHFGIEVQLISVLNFRYGYRYEPFQDYFEKGVSTLGFSVDTKYVSLHYGRWINKDNISALYSGSYVIGLSVGNIPF